MDSNNQNQDVNVNETVPAPAPKSAFSKFEENPAQETLRTGGMILSFVSMFNSFSNIIKNLFSKK